MSKNLYMKMELKMMALIEFGMDLHFSILVLLFRDQLEILMRIVLVLLVNLIVF